LISIICEKPGLISQKTHYALVQKQRLRKLCGFILWTVSTHRYIVWRKVRDSKYYRRWNIYLSVYFKHWKILPTSLH